MLWILSPHGYTAVMTTQTETSLEAELHALLAATEQNAAVTDAMAIYRRAAPLVPMLVAARPLVSFSTTTSISNA